MILVPVSTDAGTALVFLLLVKPWKWMQRPHSLYTDSAKTNKLKLRLSVWSSTYFVSVYMIVQRGVRRGFGLHLPMPGTAKMWQQ